MRTPIEIMLVAALAACGGKTAATESDHAGTAAAEARWHCITYEDAPSECSEEPCPDSDAYACVPASTAWCFEPPLRDRECAMTSSECADRAKAQLATMQEEDGGDVPAACVEMK